MKKSGIKWMIPPDEHLTLRTSFIKMFLRCPAQAMFRYFKGIVALPKSYATFGSCMHKAAEHQNKHKLKRGRDARLSVLQDVFHEEFKIRRKHTQWLKKENPNKIELEGTKKCLPIYYTKLAKKVEPIYVEEGFAVKIPEANVTITGQIDLVQRRHVIRDLKTRSKAPNWLDPIKSTQKVSYYLGYKTKFKRRPKHFVLDYLLRTSDPRMEHSEPQMVSDSDIIQFKMMVQNISTTLRQGLFYPRKENNYLCSPHSCGYWGICSRGAWMKLPRDGKTFMSNMERYKDNEKEGEE